MRVLTIKQPWASLIIRGIKPVENRDWYTGIRERIGIHSSAKLDLSEFMAAYSMCLEMELPPDQMPMQEPKRIAGRGGSLRFAETPVGYPAGVILGTAYLADCVSEHPSPWFVGEHGLVMKEPAEFKVPLPAKGQLGFWECPDLDKYESEK